MTLQEELEKNAISSNYFNLLSEKSHYSREFFKDKQSYKNHIIRKLKEKYPNLSGQACDAIYGSSLVGEGFKLKDIIIVDQTAISFINYKTNSTPFYDSYRIRKMNDFKNYYRKIDDIYFQYNLDDKSPYYKKDGQGNIQILNPNDTGLDIHQSIQYSHALAKALTLFCKEQDHDIGVKPIDQKNQNNELYNYGNFQFISKRFMVSYDLFIDCNYVTLATSFAQKKDVEVNMLLFKGRKLEIAATLKQRFDSNGNCIIEIKSQSKDYFSLNNGYLKTSVKNELATVFELETKPLLQSSIHQSKNNKFPYNVILIDEEDKENFIKALPKIVAYPIIIIPNFKTTETMIQYFRKMAIDYIDETKKPLLISKNQEYITYANFFGMDTCFVNNGLNDTISYKTTYEVKNLERIRKLKIK